MTARKFYQVLYTDRLIADQNAAAASKAFVDDVFKGIPLIKPKCKKCGDTEIGFNVNRDSTIKNAWCVQCNSPWNEVRL